MSQSDIDWEIEQVTGTIAYYERALASSVWPWEAEKYQKMIHELTGKVKQLQGERDGVVR